MAGRARLSLAGGAMARHRTTAQQLADAEAKLSRLRQRQRQEDTRRRILVGSMFLTRAERDEVISEQLMRELDTWLTDERDRRLFVDWGLGPIRGLYRATLTPAIRQPGWSVRRGGGYATKA